MITAFTLILAVLLDMWLGEPRQWHPLAAFGTLAQRIERRMHGGPDGDNAVRGAWALLLAVLPFTVIAWLLSLVDAIAVLVEVLLLYLAIGATSLVQHGRAVAEALSLGDLPLARQRVGWMVSRDTAELDGDGVARAAVESVLENGNDAVFGALFWFVLLGAPGVVLYRLVNTLDAMWGYRTERYHQFGYAAAKLDDLLNWLPARLTALGYLLAGDRARGWRCWRHQGRRTDSPNAGVVMATGAGALGVQVGGPASYHGAWQEKPLLGEGMPARGPDIYRAIRLVQRALLLWLVVITVLGVLFG